MVHGISGGWRQWQHWQNYAAGVVTEFPAPAGNFPFCIAAGPDGNLWFTDQFGNKIGKINPSGTSIAEFSVPTSNSGPSFIAAGLDGNLWFTESNGDNIGKITPQGAITEFPVPVSNSRPSGIAAGPDGNLWFTELYANNIGEAPLAAPASDNACNGGYSGTYKGNLTISAGQVCSYGLGSVTGNVQVNKGGQLSLNRTDVSGNVQGNMNDSYSIQAATIDGNLQIDNVPPNQPLSQVGGSTVSGNVTISNSATATHIGAFPAGACARNQIGGNLQIMNNTAPIQVGFNTVKNNLQCQNNAAITGGGNTAKQKQDQCKSF